MPKLGPFIQNTSGAEPPVQAVRSFVQYVPFGVSWTSTLTPGRARSKARAARCMAGSW